MKAWLPRIGFVKSQAHSLQKWERIRAKGKTRFVAQIALMWGVTVVGITHAYTNLFIETSDLSLRRVIYHVFIGIPVGLIAWRQGEKEYQKALREIRVKAVAVNSSPSDTQGLSKT